MSVTPPALPSTVPPATVSAFAALHAKLVAEWAGLKTQLASSGWFSVNATSVSAAFQFLTSSVEQLSGLADSSGLVNADKKAAVLAYANSLFESVVAAEFPVAALPAAKLLEGEIDSILSGLIEYLVGKLHGVAPTPAPVTPPSPAPSGSGSGSGSGAPAKAP